MHSFGWARVEGVDCANCSGCLEGVLVQADHMHVPQDKQMWGQ